MSAINKSFSIKKHIYHDDAVSLQTLKSPSYGLSRTAVYK